MPYIKKVDRKELHSTRTPSTVGELNYMVTCLAHTFIKESGGINYSNINKVIGVLECAKLELYRQIAVPYEDTKKIDNGPVTDLD